VVFHPEEYPMSWTWLTGKISLDQVRHRHPRWYQSVAGPKEEPAQESADHAE